MEMIQGQLRGILQSVLWSYRFVLNRSLPTKHHMDRQIIQTNPQVVKSPTIMGCHFIPTQHKLE